MRHYDPKLIPRAKTLRKEATPWERRLWYDFLRTYPIRFQRQYSVGTYILDFYCARAKLAVELDGSGHYEPHQQTYDENRTLFLQKLGIYVLRFNNPDIHKNFRGVCEMIDRVARKRLEDSSF